MRITTVDVMSVNGRVAKAGGDAHSWTSDDDWDHFRTLANQHNLLVMDLETYQIVQPEPEKERLRVIVTENPGAQSAIPGEIEFMNGTPENLVKQLAGRGYKKMLLVGKGINAQFLRAGLVNEMVVTIEPVVFGGGLSLLDVPGLDVPLRLRSIEQLNERGTLVAWYLVDKPASSQ